MTHYGPPPAQPPQDNSKKFLNMSGGVLALVIALVIVLPVLGCIGCCVFGSIGGMLGNVDPAVTP